MVEHSPQIPPLPDSYRKAHRDYVLSSAILLAWALVGIEIKETPLQNVNIALKSPAAIPYILVVLVLYFSYRTVIEWLQCDSQTRSVKAARFDFNLSHIIGVSSLLVFAIQELLHAQIFDYLTGKAGLLDLVGFGLFCLAVPLSLEMIFRRNKYKTVKGKVVLSLSVLLALLGTILILLFFRTLPLITTLATYIVFGLFSANEWNHFRVKHEIYLKSRSSSGTPSPKSL
jgi:hypothetical protein